MISPHLASVLADREILYVFTQVGCPACEVAIPELDRFMSRHPTLTVLTLDAAGPYPGTLGITIRATPTYAFRRGDEVIRHEGALKLADLEKWLKRIR